MKDNVSVNVNVNGSVNGNVQDYKSELDTQVEVTLKDYYDHLWRCRDFELTNLWQRSIFLTAFIVLAFTGYGFLLFEIVKQYPVRFDPKNSNEIINNLWSLLNLMAVFISMIGFLLSSLWIKMGKGSKLWYEKYEEAIIAFEKHEDYCDKEFKRFGGFDYSKIKDYRNLVPNRCLLNLDAGNYSPSRINIAIGIVSLFIWTIICSFHCFILFNPAEINSTLFIVVGAIIILYFSFFSDWVTSKN